MFSRNYLGRVAWDAFKTQTYDPSARERIIFRQVWETCMWRGLLTSRRVIKTPAPGHAATAEPE